VVEAEGTGTSHNPGPGQDNNNTTNDTRRGFEGRDRSRTEGKLPIDTRAWAEAGEQKGDEMFREKELIRGEKECKYNQLQSVGCYPSVAHPS
jgi:hypothetical protein